MALKRILVVVGVLLLAFTSFSFEGGKTAVINISDLPQLSAEQCVYKRSYHALVSSLEPSSHLDKKRKLRVRYMKAEIGNITPVFTQHSVPLQFSDQAPKPSYSCIFCSEYYELHKLRGPPFIHYCG